MAKSKKETQKNEQLPSEYYQKGLAVRKNYEDRGKLIAKLTLPYVIRDENDTGVTAMTDSTSQSYCGRLINTLKAKMGMALLPPATSSFRYVPNPEELAALTKGIDNNIARVHQVLSTNVAVVNAEIELQQIRTTLFDIILQQLVVGSVVVEKVKTGRKGMKLHPLQSFVASLDQQGRAYKICIVEKIITLPEGVIVSKVQDEYELYTMVTKDSDLDMWYMTQEIDGAVVGEEITYKNDDDLPFRYLGWTWMVGDAYHRPYAEDYYQDMQQLDKLAKLLTDGAIVQAKMLLFVNERGGRTRKDEVANSANGDVIDGDAADVTAFKAEKNFDFQVPAEREAMIKRQLAQAFLMSESVTRDAERVTAEEIDFMARELEASSLAGIYSKMALEFSKWNVHQIMLELKIKFESIEVRILTGLDALGRSQEAQKLDRLLQRAGTMGMLNWFKPNEALNRYASFEGVPTEGLMKTPNEVAEEQQAEQQRLAQEALVQGVAGNVGSQVGKQV